MKLDDIRRLDSQYLFQNYGREDVCFTHGEGEFLFDLDGDRYIDLVAGIAVNALGHNHPALVRAICDQAGRMIHVSNLYYIREQAELAETISSVLPDALSKSIFVNSGTEANEAALKLAVKHTGREKIVAAWNSFHGRTAAALSATGQLKYHSGFMPLLSGAFDFVGYGRSEALKEKVGAETAAIILEPIQGEGGIIIPPDDFMRTARDLCDDHGCLLIMDEVQTGFGRTGKMFGFEHYGIVPDVITLAKAMGGGFPIGAMVTSPEISVSLGPGAHGTTFGGNPLACAAAKTVVSTIRDERLHDRAADLGNRWMSRLSAAIKKVGGVKEMRGRGLMIGLDMGESARNFQRSAFDQKLLVNICGGSVIRIVPCLTIQETSTRVLDEALHAFRS